MSETAGKYPLAEAGEGAPNEQRQEPLAVPLRA